MPRRLNGVPENLRAWWERVDPLEFEQASLRCGRVDVFTHLARRRKLATAERIIDLGCGPGLLAKEMSRRDIVGIDMATPMLRAAEEHMDLVLPDNMLEHFPSDPFDVAVMCCVLEAYPEDMRRLMLRHVLEFLKPGGMAIVVISTAPDSSCGVDLLFPPPSGSRVRPDEVEEELYVAGFDMVSAELVTARTVNTLAALPGETPPTERTDYFVVTGRRAG